MEQIEIRTELLKTIDEISQEMREIIFLKYFDKLGNDKKYILSMMNEAFQTSIVFCHAVQRVCIAQAGILLRQLLEQSAISFILVSHPETLPKFIEHYKTRIEWIDLKRDEVADKISEKYDVSRIKALAYLDYGWIGLNKNKCSEDEMLKFVGFNDILNWKKKYLDKLAHSSYTSTNFLGKDGDFPILNNFIEIACKLFDYLCCAFHNLTGFAFVFNGEELFSKFRSLYSNYKI